MFKRKELTVEEFVRKAAEAMADAEEAGNAFFKKVMACAPLADEARELGLIGYLQSMEWKNKLRQSAGCAGEANAILFGLHREGTAIAQAKGIDLPAPRDGGGGR